MNVHMKRWGCMIKCGTRRKRRKTDFIVLQWSFFLSLSLQKDHLFHNPPHIPTSAFHLFVAEGANAVHASMSQTMGGEERAAAAGLYPQQFMSLTALEEALQEQQQQEKEFVISAKPPPAANGFVAHYCGLESRQIAGERRE